MPIWLSILLWFLANLPDVIRTIKEIWKLIQKLPKPEQAQAKRELKTALKTHKYDMKGNKLLTRTAPRPTFRRLHDLHERLRARTQGLK